MANLTTQVQNLLTRHDIDLLRVDASLGKEIDGILNGLSESLRNRIIRSDIVNAKPVILNKKLNQLVVVGASDIQKAYDQLTDTVVAELSDLAVLEEATVRDTINRAVRVDLASNQVHLSKLKALAGNTMIEGAPIKEWWAKQPTAIAEGFKNHIRAGMLAGEDIEAMTRRIHGSRALKYKDGLIRGPARHAAKRLVRSSVLAVANDARRLSYEANSHVIKGIQWVSTLDNKTSDLCKALDGQSWTLKGDRMRGTVVKFPGYPPAHWNCRSTTVPITKTFTELARENKGNTKKKLTGLSKSTQNKVRTSMDGKVAAKMNYEQWLANQPIEMQQEVLGSTKYDLWKAKKISFTDLVDQSGNPRSVAQLKALFDKTQFIPPAELTAEQIAAKRMKAWKKVALDTDQDANTDWEVLRLPIKDIKATQPIDNLLGKKTTKADLSLKPIKVTKGNSILDGNHRYAEALNRGDKFVYVFKATSEPWKGTGKIIDKSKAVPIIKAADIKPKVIDSPFLPDVVGAINGLNDNYSIVFSSARRYISEDDFYQKLFKESKTQVADRLKRVIDDSEVFMAIKGSTLRNQIIKTNGRFKNSLETGTGSFKTIGEARAAKERVMFGIEAGLDDYDKWPKYGFLSTPDMGNHNMIGFGYGETFVKFKKAKVLNRSTFTLGDSYNNNALTKAIGGNHRQIAPAVKLSDPDVSVLKSLSKMNPETPLAKRVPEFKDIDELAKLTEYPEAQIYGKLSMDDVAAIYTGSRKEADALAKALKKAGRTDVEIKPLKYDERVDRLKGDYSLQGLTLRASLNKSDLDRMGDGLIKGLERARIMKAVVQKFRIRLPRGELKDLTDSFIANEEAFTPIQHRRITELYQEQMALQKKGVLPEVHWEDYRPSKAGWTADVFNQELLEDWK